MTDNFWFSWPYAELHFPNYVETEMLLAIWEMKRIRLAEVADRPMAVSDSASWIEWHNSIIGSSGNWSNRLFTLDEEYETQ